nr:farnesol dehydrogenase-like [Leptinotarsa decemlineata]
MVLSMNRWIGKVAIVTGASSGIGKSIAEKLVEAGLIVVGLARRKNKLEQIAGELSGKAGKFHPVQADISSEAEILSAFKWIKENLGPIHILVNNAGVMNFGLLSEGETELWQNILQVNMIGLSVATREAIREMKTNKVDGHIIHINSTVGHYVPDIPVNMYTASKYGVTALTECLRRELATLNSKIKITSISPGGTDTEIIREVMKQSDTFQQLKENKSILDPEDIADGLIYVLSTPPHVQVLKDPYRDSI